MNWKSACFSRKTGKAEWIVLVCYMAVISIITCFHEFHFDELQAWQIAKSAPLSDILFAIPHYEGHPPLWHLLLVPFARGGLDFQWVLPCINILFSAGATAFLLFRSPFPKIVRCVLPFSYFLCYQYGVVSRPYSMMMLAFFLAAAGYKERNTHPWRYILPLCLLCLSTAYGIIAAGGMCIAWTAEIGAELLKSRKFGAFFRSARFLSLLTILLLALYLIWSIIPAEDVYFAGMLEAPTVLDHAATPTYWLMWFAMPFDTWFGSQINTDTLLETKAGLIFEAVVSVPLMAWVCLFLKKNKCLLPFLIPYLLVSLFMVLRYFAPYHLGVIALLFVSGAWIVMETPMELPQIFPKKPEYSPPIRKLLAVCAVCLCAVPEGYTISACIHEIQYEYAPVSYVNFIREHHLEDRKIMVHWDIKYDVGDDSKVFTAAAHRLPMQHPPVKYHLPDISGSAVDVIAYFDRNILMNFNSTCPDDLYMHYRWNKTPETDFALWREQGLPDFIIGCPVIEDVYGEAALEGIRYVCVDEFETHLIFKNGSRMGGNMIFIREDLLDEYPELTVIP